MTIIIASTSFENEATGAQYVNAAADGDLVAQDAVVDIINLAGLSPVDSTASSTTAGDLGFNAEWQNSRGGGVGLSDGDFVGVTDFTGVVGAFTDGSQGYQIGDADGLYQLSFDSVATNATDTITITFDYFVESTTFESNDALNFRVFDENDAEVFSLSLGELELEAAGGAWITQTIEILGVAEANLVFEFDSNSASESVTFDNVVFAATPTFFVDAAAGNDSNPGTQGSPFATIQAAVDAASAGSLINVAAGTYREQVTIDGFTDLTIVGEDGATIEMVDSPATSAAGAQALFNISASTGVVIDNVDMDGRGLATGPAFYGVHFVDSSGTVTNTDITGIRGALNPDGSPPGFQTGRGIRADNGSTTSTITLTNNTISDFQKTAIDLRGSALTVDVSGNTVIGSGLLEASDAIAQNGITLVFGVVGSVTGNTVSEIGYLRDVSTTAGILAFDVGDGLIIDGNTVLGPRDGGGAIQPANVIGVDVSGGEANDVVVTNNTLDGVLTGVRMINNVDNPTISGNTFLNPVAQFTALSGDTELGENIRYNGGSNDAAVSLNGSEGRDELVGTGFVDTLNGEGGDDFIAGLDGNDILSGGAGVDEVFGGEGDDTLNGGEGVDTAVYVGSSSDFTITAITDGDGRVTGFSAVTDTNATDGDEGADTLNGVEAVSFAGDGLLLDATQAVQLFNGDGDLVGTFDTIQAAIDASADGFTVSVADGTYAENLTISTDIELVSVNGAPSTTIEGVSGVGALGAIVLSGDTDGVTIGGAGVGFTIVGIDNGNPAVENAAIYFDGPASNTLIENNFITAKGEAGILSEFGTANLVSGVQILNNFFDGVTFDDSVPVSEFSGSGFGSAQFTETNVPRQAVTLNTAQNTLFAGNAVTTTVGGFDPDGGFRANTLVTIDGVRDGVTINANVAENNIFAGVQVDPALEDFPAALRMRGEGVTITDNQFDQGRSASIFTDASDAAVTGNEFFAENPAGGPDADTLVGSIGDDIMTGGGDMDTIFGLAGDDVITGDGNADVLEGGDGNDMLFGGTGADTLNGGADDDVLDGGTNTNILNGGAGDDTIIVQGSETVDGGDDIDTAILADLDGSTVADLVALTTAIGLAAPVGGVLPIDLGEGVVNVTVSGSVTDGAIDFTASVAGEDPLSIVGVEILKVENVASSAFLVFEGMSVQAAIDAAEVGDTIILGAGTFTDTIVVDKAVNFVGGGVGVTTIDPTSGFGFDITGDLGTDNTVSITGVSVTGATRGVDFDDNAILGALEITDSEFTANTDNGVAVGANNNPVDLDSVIISNTTFTGNGQPGGSSGDGDILLFQYFGDATLSDLTIVGQDRGTGPAENAIQLRGDGGAAGTITLTNVDVSGLYEKQPLAVFGYSDVSGLTGSGNSITADSTGFQLAANFDGIGGDIDFTALGLDATGAPDVVALQGNSDSQTITSGAEDSFLRGGEGNDVLAGGAGFDVAGYAGSSSDYAIARTLVEGRVTNFNGVADANTADGDEGTDFLSGVETLTFFGDGLTLDLTQPVQLLDGTSLLGTFDTIQAAVDAASDGNTINVAAGTFREQVSVDGFTDLTIIGAGDTTVIEMVDAPAFTNNGVGSRDRAAVVSVTNSENVTLEGVKLDARGLGETLGSGSTPEIVNLFLGDASGTIEGVTATGARDELNADGTPKGNQRGQAIVVSNDDASARTVDIIDSTVEDFQKNGIRAEGEGLTLNLTGSTVSGSGFLPAPNAIAQNALVFVGGATGTVDDNVFDGIGYQRGDFVTTNILSIGAADGLTITNNTFEGATDEFGVAQASTNGPIFIQGETDDIVVTGNTIEANTFGIIVFGNADNPTIESNSFLNMFDQVTTNTGQGTFFGTQLEFFGDANDAPLTLDGTDGTDVLVGTAFADTLNGEGGDDFIDGGDGNDILSGGAGIDEISGGEGDDVITGEGNRNILNGDAGNDTITIDGTEDADGGDDVDTAILADLEGAERDDLIDFVNGAAIAIPTGSGATIAIDLGGGAAAADVTLSGSVTNGVVEYSATIPGEGDLDVDGFEILKVEETSSGDVFLVFDGMSIQAAIDAADFNDVIIVGAGTYTEDLVIDERIDLIGAQFGVEGFDAGRATGADATGESRIVGNVDVTGEGVFIDGFFFDIAAQGSDAAGGEAIIEVTGESATIRNSRVFEDGVGGAPAANFVVTGDDAFLTDNFIEYVGGAFTSGNVGVQLAGDGTAFQSNVVSGDRIGITIADGETINVMNNDITEDPAFTDFIFAIGAGGGFPPVPAGAVLEVEGNDGNGEGIDFLGIDANGIFRYFTSAQAAQDFGNVTIQEIASGDLILLGTENPDVITGTAANEQLFGLGDDDTLIGGAGADLLDGGEGVDTADYSSAGSFVDVRMARGIQREGEAEGDRLDSIEILIGTDFNDFLGAAGDGVVSQVFGGLGEDQLFGTSRDADFLSGGEGNDTLTGFGQNDTLIGGAGADVIDGGAGFDTVDYSDSAAGVDVRLFRAGGQKNGDAQGDVLTSVERVIGTDFVDALVSATNVAATLEGRGGNDFVFGASANDTLLGGEGDDMLIGRGGGDVIDGGEGVDTADYSTAGSSVDVVLARGVQRDGDAQGDQLSSIEIVIGTDFNDVLGAVSDGFMTQLFGGLGDDQLSGASQDGDMLSGGAGADTLNGNGGDDVLIGGADGDIIDGGAGFDTVDYSDSAAGVDVRLFRAGGQQGGDAQGDVLTGVERLIGSDFADALVSVNGVAATLEGGEGGDFLFGANQADTIFGQEGDDTIEGRAGADIIDGGLGVDTLTGDAGADTFVFAVGTGGDTITDFTDGEDLIDLTGGTAASIADLSFADVPALGAVISGFGDTTDVIVLEGVNSSVLDASDFLF